jgi:outer membrane protein TolC
MAGVQVPIAPWSLAGVRHAERRARAMRDRADRDVAALALTARAEIESSRAAWEAAVGRARLARERTVPLSQRIAAVVRAEYAAGSAGFAEVTGALREERTAREEYHRATADCLKAWADLEYAVGGWTGKERSEKWKARGGK